MVPFGQRWAPMSNSMKKLQDGGKHYTLIKVIISMKYYIILFNGEGLWNYLAIWITLGSLLVVCKAQALGGGYGVDSG